MFAMDVMTCYDKHDDDVGSSCLLLVLCVRIGVNNSMFDGKFASFSSDGVRIVCGEFSQPGVNVLG